MSKQQDLPTLSLEHIPKLPLSIPSVYHMPSFFIFSTATITFLTDFFASALAH
jgi:hypothetical protein